MKFKEIDPNQLVKVVFDNDLNVVKSSFYLKDGYLNYPTLFIHIKVADLHDEILMICQNINQSFIYQVDDVDVLNMQIKKSKNIYWLLYKNVPYKNTLRFSPSQGFNLVSFFKENNIKTLD